ncbi:MAG: DUF6781 family protein [Burkholderiaceae bacterium]
MIKSGIDQQALASMFSQATEKQGDALRKAVGDATLKALQSREMTLRNIRSVLQSVTQATSAGAASSALPAVDVQGLLGKAIEGMDAALLRAVEAQKTALAQFVQQGVGAQEKQMAPLLANLEKMEDVFFDTVTKAAQGAGAPLQGPWGEALSALKLKGSDTGASASATVEQLMAQARSTMREGRAASLRSAESLMKGYATLVSGILIGMTEGMHGATMGSPGTKGAAPAPDADAPAARKSRK